MASSHMAMYISGPPLHPAQTQIATATAAQAQTPVFSPGSIRNCVRLRGMPYSATVEDILQFLGDLRYGILPNGIHMVLNQQGRPSGDAFIQMNSPERAAHAALDISKGGCHKKHMGERYVEVFQCSGDEMNMVLMGGTLNRNGIQPPPGMGLLLSDQMAIQRPEPHAFPATYAIPAPQLMLHQPPLEVLQPQTVMPPVPGHRPVYAQSALLPCAAYLPTPSVSPTVSGAQNVQALTHTALPHQLALAPHALAPHPALGIQVRMQGMSYNSGMTDILSLIKQQQQHPQHAPYFAAGKAAEYQSATTEEKRSPGQVTATQSFQNEWTCIV